jgi:rhodanese-related sulfurtransferase
MTRISPKELQEKLQHEEIFLLDVREPYEHEAFNIGGTLLPLADLMNNSASIPIDRPVVVYCKKGIRSQIAIQRLQDKLGLSNLINLTGGMDAWKRDIL